MAYTCPICSESIDGDIVDYSDHVDQHVVDLIKFDHPEWIEESGFCPKCYAYYKSEIEGSVFKDAPCAKRVRFVRKLFRPIAKILIKAKPKKRPEA